MNDFSIDNPAGPVCAQEGVCFTCRLCGADAVQAEKIDIGPWVFDPRPFIYITLRCRECRAEYLGGTEFKNFTAIEGDPNEPAGVF